MEFEDVAHELGLSKGTLENKLKPSDTIHDMSLTEFTHFLELTGDYAALEHIANKFDFMMLRKKESNATVKDINALADKANIENNDVFKSIKNAIEDGVITEAEQAVILKEIDEAEKATAEFKESILNLNIYTGFNNG